MKRTFYPIETDYDTGTRGSRYQTKAWGEETRFLGVSALSRRSTWKTPPLTQTSCETCRKQKEKCEGGQPCWRCQRLDRPCHFQGQPVQRATTPPSSTSVASILGDKKRIQSLEKVARHFLGDVALDEENIGRIAERLQTSATHTQPEVALDVNESFDVHFVSNNVAHYSGEFSHWNFSQMLRRRMSSKIGQLDASVSDFSMLFFPRF